jgi:ParB family transcriptional regulator, chromosome partitioning protein
MTDIIHVPLNRLALWDGNVRKTDIKVGIDELSQSIKAHGLLQSLVVRKGKRGKFEIVAGQRRYLALKHLADHGDLVKDCSIPCALANEELDASEISLAENVVRAPMHPADQFEAFRAIIDSGATVADVAARFGIAETTVGKRLKLARLSSVILDAYRQGDIDLEVAQAFTVSDDCEAQERVFAELSDWNRRPDTIRRALTAADIPTSDKRVRLVGIDAYRDAGGLIRQDLFDDDGSGYLTDTTLLDRLVNEKLETIRTEVSTEGWAWAETAADTDYGFFSVFKRLHPRVEFSESDQLEHDQLSQEYDRLADSDENHDQRLAEIESRLEALSGASEIWPAETLAVAGAIITIDYDGDVRIERGLVRKEDAHKLIDDTDESAASGKVGLPHPGGLSPRLVQDLTAQRSAAIGAELLQRPDVALAAVVHAFVLDTFYVGHGTESALKISARKSGLSDAIANPNECNGLRAIEQECQRVRDRLPDNPQELWDCLLERSRDELLEMLALVAATTVDAMQRKGDSLQATRLQHAKHLGHALQLNMSTWFNPTAENYFGRVTRDQILAAIDEAKGSHGPALEKLKKSQLAARAEQMLAGTSWLPELLRNPASDVLALAAE